MLVELICYYVPMSLQVCYLIGGAPLTGKSTLSDLWAQQHQATQLSTDSIRAWMKRITRPEDYPYLFASSTAGPIEFYEEYDTAQKVLDQQVNEGTDVLKGIEAFLQCALTMKQLILEGIAITPDSANYLIANFPHIKFEVSFLFDDDVARIKNRIHERGLWGPKGSYPQHLEEKEVEWVVLYNQYYKLAAQKHGFKLIHADDLIA